MKDTRIKRLTYKQFAEALAVDSKFIVWNALLNDRKPWKVARFKSRHPFVFA